MPHASESFVDFQHDLWRLTTPSELKQFLPNVARISMNHSVGNPAKKFADHGGLVILWHRIECLLYNVTTERVHAESNHIAVDCVRNSNDLVRSTMFEASLDKKVTETIDHQRVCLRHDRLDDLELLLSCADLELLLEEDACLLVIVTDDLVDNVLPVA